MFLFYCTQSTVFLDILTKPNAIITHSSVILTMKGMTYIYMYIISLQWRPFYKDVCNSYKTYVLSLIRSSAHRTKMNNSANKIKA